MSDQNPQIKDDPMYRLLREGEVEEFNTRRAGGEACDLCGSDFRTLDLRKLDAKGLDLRDCYFRQADLRGVDFSEANLEGASINAAKISGAYFPHELSAEAIDETLAVNVRSVLLLSSRLANSLIARRGNIINLSSISSLGGASTQAVYVASKGAIDSLTINLAREWGEGLMGYMRRVKQIFDPDEQFNPDVMFSDRALTDDMAPI